MTLKQTQNREEYTLNRPFVVLITGGALKFTVWLYEHEGPWILQTKPSHCGSENRRGIGIYRMNRPKWF